MLTEAEKKWLKQKENLDEVSEICYTVGSCEDCYAKESCYLWPNDYRDAAEFEARVAARMAQSPCWSCPEKSKLSCPRGKSEANGRPKAEACRLKHARLTEEEEMENGRTF